MSKETETKAIVTRYPTGCFGINHNGSMFFWWGWNESEARAKIKELGIPKRQVKWEERYYDLRFDINDPRCYSTRKFYPAITSSTRKPESTGSRKARPWSG